VLHWVAGLDWILLWCAVVCCAVLWCGVVWCGVVCCAVPDQVTVMPPDQLPPEHSSHLVLPALGPGKVFSKSFDGWGLQVRVVRSRLLTPAAHLWSPQQIRANACIAILSSSVLLTMLQMLLM
jgi:hypothetical protein